MTTMLHDAPPPSIADLPVQVMPRVVSVRPLAAERRTPSSCAASPSATRPTRRPVRPGASSAPATSPRGTRPSTRTSGSSRCSAPRRPPATTRETRRRARTGRASPPARTVCSTPSRRGTSTCRGSSISTRSRRCRTLPLRNPSLPSPLLPPSQSSRLLYPNLPACRPTQSPRSTVTQICRTSALPPQHLALPAQGRGTTLSAAASSSPSPSLQSPRRRRHPGARTRHGP